MKAFFLVLCLTLSGCGGGQFSGKAGDQTAIQIHQGASTGAFAGAGIGFGAGLQIGFGGYHE